MCSKETFKKLKEFEKKVEQNFILLTKNYLTGNNGPKLEYFRNIIKWLQALTFTIQNTLWKYVAHCNKFSGCSILGSKFGSFTVLELECLGLDRVNNDWVTNDMISYYNGNFENIFCFVISIQIPSERE